MRGPVFGVIMGSVFTLVALGFHAISDASQIEGMGLNPLRVAIVYLAGGFLGGWVYEFARPLIRKWPFGGAVVGVLVAIPVVTGFAMAIEGEDIPLGARVFAAVFASLYLGGVIGHTLLRAR
jgi:hypothetical protein